MIPNWSFLRKGRANPVWVREMRQFARLPRTSLILATLTTAITLLVASIGGIGSASSDPADMGSILYQVFFSLSFAVVACLGPGVGALTIASEKSARTWEVLQLTGLSTSRIARGKFVAALTYVLMYVVMLAPVGALPFLFGGVTALEVVLAYLLLIAFSVVSVGFGLAISATVDSPVAAMLVTVPLAAVAAVFGYFGLGLGLSVGAAELWPILTPGAPVWLPTALAQVDVDGLYAWLLVYTPAALGVCACWFFYELTVSNLSQPEDDRTSGLKRWFVASAALLLPVFCIPRGLIDNRADYLIGTITAVVAMTLFALFALFVFCGDAVHPSRRVAAMSRGQNTTPGRRLLGPGIAKSGAFVCSVSTLIVAGMTVSGTAQEHENAAILGTLDSSHLVALWLVSGYSSAFILGCTGFMVYVRTRSISGTAPRLLLIGLLLLGLVGPWVVMAIFGMVTGDPGAMLWLAAPSPSFLFLAVEHVIEQKPDSSTLAMAGAASACVWAGLGLLLFVLGSRIAARSAREAVRV